MTNNQDFMNSLQLRANIGEGAITHKDLKPQFVYEADNDEETRVDDDETGSEMDDEDDELGDEFMDGDDLEEEVELEDEEEDEIEEEVVAQKRRKTKEKKAADLQEIQHQKLKIWVFINFGYFY